MEPSLTSASYLVLGIVDMLGEASPYDIKRFSATFVAPFWSLPHSQIYAQCARLSDQALLEAVGQDDHPRRRRPLRVTTAGAAALDQWRAEPTETPVEARDLAVLKNFFGGPTETIAQEQAGRHRARLAEYRQWRAELAPHFDDAQSAALELGLRYEELMADYWQQLIDDGPGAFRVAAESKALPTDGD